MSANGPFTGLWVTARWVGAQTWWSRRLFALTGGWVPSEADAAARIHLAGTSRVLGEVGEAWARHLPPVADVDHGALVVPPTVSVGRVLDRLAEAGGTARLAGLHRVVTPRLIVDWGQWAARASAATDAALLRTVGHARADLLAAWETGEGLIQAAAESDPSGVAATAANVADLEASLARAVGEA